MKAKKLVVSLACGHTLVLMKSEVSLALNGNHASCPKCPWNAPPRRVTERSWVAADKEV